MENDFNKLSVISQPGIYFYALIADGQEVDVKRMILTK